MAKKNYSDYSKFELQFNLYFEYWNYFTRVKTLFLALYGIFYKLSKPNATESGKISLYRLSIKVLATIDEMDEIVKEINKMSNAYMRMYSVKKPPKSKMISSKRKSKKVKRRR